MEESKELQEKVLTYKILESRGESLVKQRDMIINKILELQSTIASIDEMEKSEDVLIPLGSEAYAFGKTTEKKKLIVEIGANVALEKTLEEGRDTLMGRKEELENALGEIEKEVSGIAAMMNKLGPEIQTLSQKENVKVG